MNISDTIKRYVNKEISVYENTLEVLNKIENDSLNAYISVDRENALERAKFLDEKLKNGEKLGKLFGIAVSVKDNISYDSMKMTCGSKMLQDFKPVYNATVVENILNEDAIIVAKTNMDEFAMGSSSQSSYFGSVNNPLDKTLIPGGSSSGSAVSVAKGDVLVSLGTDTGGSVRQPASYCNIIGYKPSYSLMSRYGVVSMANTLDQVSILGKNVADIRQMANVSSSVDKHDMTSILNEYDFSKEIYDFKGKKVAYVKNQDELYTLDNEVEKDYKKALDQLKELGADLVGVDLNYAKYANEIYNVIMSSEVSSNMSRFDGIRYGYQTDNYKDITDLFVKNRSEGFGEEVQRRIALGTMYLSSDDDQRVYKQGLKIRTLIKRELEDVFENNDIFITPTTIDLPRKLGENIDDPLSDFKSDGFNVIVNLAGMCAISMPVRKGISGSIQFIANRFEDKNLLNAAEEFERSLNEN